MEKYKLQIGIGLGTVIGGLLGWWHGFAGWPVWAAIPFLVGLGALIGYRSINQDRRGLVWLILWMLPGALFGLLAGVIGKAEPVGIIHLALEFAVYAAIIGLLGPGNGRAGIMIGGLLVGGLGLAQSLIGELPEVVKIGGVQFQNLDQVQYIFINTLQTLFLGGVLGGLSEFGIRSLRAQK
jgi:hypothetical protein